MPLGWATEPPRSITAVEQVDIVMSILDPKWKYTHSTATDIRKTFAKARRKLAQGKPVQTRKTPEAKVAQVVLRERRG
jgi:hypothetical protein